MVAAISEWARDTQEGAEMSREPSDEQKAIIIMADVALDIAIRNSTFRWLFCWDGEDSTCFDCACCLTWDEDLKNRCDCVCHKRIIELQALLRVALRSMESHNKSWFWDRGIDGKQKEQR